MIERKYEEPARKLAEALRAMAEKPETIENFESYLSFHFGPWLEKFASTPDGLAAEFEQFAVPALPF